MIELVDPEVRFKTELASMTETERKDYLLRYYRQQAERFRHDGLRLERQSSCLKRNSEGYQKDWMNELEKNAELKLRIAALKAELSAVREALLQAAAGHDVMIVETVMAYNQDLVLGEREMSDDEMKALVAEKFTISIPITAES